MKAGFGLLLVAITVLSASCDRAARLTYYIKNIGADSISVIVARKDGAKFVQDTFKISYNETISIGSVDRGLGYVGNYKHKGALIEDFKTIDIYDIRTGKKTPTDFLQTSLWTYKENGTYMADYTATVTGNDLK